MHTPSIDAAVRAAAASSHGIITWRRLQALGVTKKVVARLERDGVVRRLYRGVYTIDRIVALEGRMLAAVMAVGGGAVLSHRSAARQRGLLRVEFGPVHVTTRASAHSRPGIVVHRDRIDASEIEELDGIPVTTVARTLLDIAESERELWLHKAIDAAYDKRLLPVGAIDHTLAVNACRHGARALTRALDRHAPGAHRGENDFEDALIAILVEAGIPLPETQKPMVLLDGTEIRPDASWPAGRLIVELDGGGHFNERRARSDRRRDALLAAMGWRVLRFTWHQVTHEPGFVAAAIRAALAPAP